MDELIAIIADAMRAHAATLPSPAEGYECPWCMGEVDWEEFARIAVENYPRATG